MISYLRSHWDPQLPMPKIIALRGELDEMLQRIRSSRNIKTPVLICPNCGLRAHGADPHVTVRAMILSLGRFGIMSQAETKTLEKRWKQYRAINQLNLIGDPIDTEFCQADTQAPDPNDEIPVELRQGEDSSCVTNTSASSWCCTKDGRWPPEVGLQEQASNCPVLLRSKGRGGERLRKRRPFRASGVG
jgi:hypothetical protein